MKYLIIIFIFALSNNEAFAENWLNYSKIKSESKEAFSLKSDCERISGEKCYDLGDYPSSIFSEIDVEVDDNSKPLYSKNEVQSCSSEETCQAINASKQCSIQGESPIVRLDTMEVYCSRLVGYEKKLEKSISLDQAKYSAWQSQKAIEATKSIREEGIQKALKRISCGERVVALMVLRNGSKTLTTAQIAQTNQIYGGIRALLGTGSLVTAKEQMQLVTVDGVMVTAEDKSELIAETDSCIQANQ